MRGDEERVVDAFCAWLGLALLRDDDTLETLIARADSELYRARGARA